MRKGKTGSGEVLDRKSLKLSMNECQTSTHTSRNSGNTSRKNVRKMTLDISFSNYRKSTMKNIFLKKPERIKHLTPTGTKMWILPSLSSETL